MTPTCADAWPTMTSTVLYGQPGKEKRNTKVYERPETKRKAMDDCQEGRGGQPGSSVPESESDQVKSHTDSLPATSVPFVGHPRPGRKGPIQVQGRPVTSLLRGFLL
jgi:hypothetical protein